ncbi:MAG: hypothetical protein Q9169_004785 [Polycauliona sp. 2 TL-2023]
MQDETLVRWFLDHGASPNVSAGPTKFTKRSFYSPLSDRELDITPISVAVRESSFDIVKLLVHHGGGSTAHGQLLNVASNRTDPDSVPVLQFLFDHGDTRVSDTWLEDQHDLDCNYTFDNATPLHHAIVGILKTAIAGNPSFTSREDLPWDPAATKFFDIACGRRYHNKGGEESYQSSPTGPRTDINMGNGVRSQGANYAQQDYSMYLMLLERENKKRLALEKSKRETALDDPKNILPKTAQVRVEDLQMQAFLQDAQRKKH